MTITANQWRMSIRQIALAALLTLTFPAWAKVGWIERTQGKVLVTLPSGRTQAVQVGDPLEEGQRVETGADGEALIHFVDEALLALRPNTKVDISQYSYHANDKRSISALRLVKGGLRFVTGLIGKISREQVTIITPVATIGVRGTDFDTVFLDAPSGDNDAGVYTCVTEGGTYLQDEAGRRIDIDQGQTAFATNADMIAKGLSKAREWGLIRPPAGLFQSGTFDGQVDDLKREALNRLQSKLTDQIPEQLRGMVPGDLLTGLFASKKKPAAASGVCRS